ncbi:hypothetical protein MKW94_004058 [Papaver nudicaule]|uniref:Uncharacterized protein n=1 Tax=Papaver nudicaule TaxID=74823 RepID=A0AA41VUH2_PAPNU|nr:hypothetical protein [Papaver nudicaule]
MAKTYMKSRPPWASPSSSHVGFRTPSPIRMHLLKEETPIGGRSMSASKFIRRSPIVNDSQEILAELRRVRLKSEEATMIMENDGVVNETTSLVRADQDLEDPRFKESVEGSARVNNTSEVMEMEYTDDSRRPVGLNPSKEINGTTDRVTSNGAPPSASSLSAGLNVGPENEGSSESRLGIGLIPLEEETCEPSSEAAVQIPDDGDEEIDGGAIGPETSSSGHSIEFEPTSRKSNSTLVGKQPQEEKKSGKSSRRGRGRGKSQA